MVVPRRRGFGRLVDDLRLVLRLRQRRFDLVLDFHGGPRSSCLALASGARRRIGYANPGRTWMYTDAVARSRGQHARHAVENQWDLLAPLGTPFRTAPTTLADAVEMPDEPVAAAVVERKLAEMGVRPEHQLIVVHVSAGNPFRRWPADAFAGLLERLVASKTERRILITSGPSDAAAASAVRNAACARGPAVSRSILPLEDFDLAELRAVIARAALFVGGDSGPLHVAATTRVPVVGIYGPTLATRSAPWRDPACVTLAAEPGPLQCRPCNQRVCTPGDFRCLTTQSAESVAALAERALAPPARGAAAL
jgi:ADP-heptose:LPS heptosyltransferase